MTRLLPARFLALALVSAVTLAACESAEDRAARHYAQAVELVERGDVTRAMLELRNVFNHDGAHLEARRLFADLNMEIGDISMATRHLLLLAEQAPDDVEVRQTLSELAIDRNNWAEARRHGEAALRLDPDHPRSTAIGVALQYQQAIRDSDDEARETLFTQATELVDQQPENFLPRRVVIDYLIASDAPERALPEIDAALELQPEDHRLHSMKVTLLNDGTQPDAVTAQLELMVELFPENEELGQDLVRWHLSQGRPDLAEEFLRDLAARHGNDPERLMLVVRLLANTQGMDAARAELESQIEAAESDQNADVFRAALATLDHSQGNTDAAIAELTEIIARSEPSDLKRDLRMQLAMIHEQEGRRDDARNEVETILSQDRSHVNALVQRASWLIEEGSLQDAQRDLRSAQSQDPRNPAIMTNLGIAFLRDGATDLAGEQFASAVQASGNAPAETLRYVSFLLQQGRTSAIGTLLTDSLRVAPNDLNLLTATAEHFLRTSRWAEARGIVERLSDLQDPEGDRRAQQLRAAILLGQNQIDEGLSVLQQQARPDTGDFQSVATVLTAQIRAGRTEAAREYLEELRAAQPDALELLLLEANLEALLGNVEGAERRYREILSARPEADNAALLLYGLLRGEGRADEADELLQTALDVSPESIPLLLTRARDLENTGQFDAAISIYERMHAVEPDNLVIANNLASMLTTYRTDDEDLDRAAVLASPLRNSEVPAFQDTFGWIAFRQGQMELAEQHLVPAAEALPNEPLVQYHLGRLMVEQGRDEEAIEQLERALDLMSGRDLPQIRSARAHLEELRNAPPAN